MDLEELRKHWEVFAETDPLCLPHVAPELARNSVREFVRALAPGGALNGRMPGGHPPPAPPQETATEERPARHPSTTSDAPLSRSGARADLFVMIPPVVLE